MQTRPLALLVDDRVDGDGGLAGLAVADDQLALAAADRDERVDGLDARLDGRVHALADDDAGGDSLDRAGLRGDDRALVVQRPPQRVHDAAQERLADGDFDDATGRLDRVAFLDVAGIAEDDGTHRLFLEVEGHAHHAAGELQQLLRQRVRQAVDLRDAVADLHHGADAARLDGLIELVDGRLDDADDFVRANGHVFSDRMPVRPGVSPPAGSPSIAARGAARVGLAHWRR